ncbi:hypothetical protein QQM39_40160 [Streptomyces sp. DT2A-34]|uniref:hypothetical protein n=1 Tax=Streptomyces sp. DT2A-34 TaxID=3051182 RepID=UPI00265BECF8|nr:hypothetical protein [Streptomyces sp. DT2A-34]MDO0916807.1 hypothetical protein [Streptomyces sp. DT2A-34]
MHAFDSTNPTPAQLDGIVCAGEDGPMVPVATVDGWQIFAHRMCVEPTPRSGVVLVVGDTSSRVALEDLVAFAYDCADRLQMPAKVAVGRGYDVSQYEAVVRHDSWMDTVDSVVLGIEAREADMFCIDADTLYAYPISTVCAHCWEDDDAAPVLAGDTWTPPVCRPCVEEAARMVATGALLVAA